MADKFYGLNNVNKFQPEQVVVGSSTGSTDLEIRIDTGKSWTTSTILAAIKAIYDRIECGYRDIPKV